MSHKETRCILHVAKISKRAMCGRLFLMTINFCSHDLSGSKVASPGESIGNGLTKTAAAELGLWEGMPVGTALIDAHAGGLGKSAFH